MSRMTRIAGRIGVIHSFWAPRLFGKQDVVPGRTNHITFSADRPGTYTGQCAEFCGLEHGRMKFKIVALDAASWQAWVAHHKQPAASPTDSLAQQGEQIFLNPLSNDRGSCVNCHSIGGTDAASQAADVEIPGVPDHRDQQAALGAR